MKKKNKVIQSLQSLDPSDFHSILVLDIAYEDNTPANPREAIFKCTNCHREYLNAVSNEKQKQKGYCPACFELSKFKYTKLEPALYKAHILYDTEYETRNRMDHREAIFQCTLCHSPFIASTNNKLLNQTGQCKDCEELNYKEELSDTISIKFIEDLGFIRTSKHLSHRFSKFECPICSTHFVRKNLHINANLKTMCNKCFAKQNKKTYSRLYSVWRGILSRTGSKYKTTYPNSIYAIHDVQMCKDWEDFNNFESWALNNGYEDNLSIDRIDSTGSYEPSNCRWATMNIQPANTRRIRSTNTLGYRGIKKAHNDKYVAQISVNNHRIHIGTYKSKLSAANGYDNYIFKHNLPHTTNFEKKH